VATRNLSLATIPTELDTGFVQKAESVEPSGRELATRGVEGKLAVEGDT
jgi:hypothetical protein